MKMYLNQIDIETIAIIAREEMTAAIQDNFKILYGDFLCLQNSIDQYINNETIKDRNKYN